MAIHWDRSDGRFRVAVYDRPGRPGRYLVRGWFAGQSREPDQVSRTGLAEAVAEAERTWDLYARGVLVAPESAPESWRELLERFEARPDLRPATARSYRLALASTVRAWGARPPATVTAHDVRAWVQEMTAKSAASRASYLRHLRAACRWAVDHGWMRTDPTEGARIDTTQQIRAWLQPEHWPAFLGACTPGQRARFGFVLETGLRKAELLAARWSWVHTTVGRPAIRIAPDGAFVPKWGQARAVPLSDAAQVFLGEARGLWGGSDRIFQGARPLRAPPWAGEVHEVCQRAGVPDTDLHGLRRSAGARWIQDGLDLLTVSRLLGHRDVSTTARYYAGLADAFLAGQIGRLPARVDPAVVPIRSRSTRRSKAPDPSSGAS